MDAVELRGSHTGVNLAGNVLTTLTDFKLEAKLFCVTGDNASNNRTMARELEAKLPLFKESEHILGCTGHVFNLAAQVGLQALGQTIKDAVFVDGNTNMGMVINDDGWGDELDESEDSHQELDQASTIIHRIREIVKAVRSSPQKRLKFENTVRVALPAFFELNENVQPPRITQKETEKLVPTRPSSSRIAARYVSFNHLIAYQ